MSGVELCVQRLRLEAPRDVSGTALQARVEDALRISSMPAALAHRFVLLRRLRLVLPRGASAQSLALQLEREWRAIEAQAQPMAVAGDEAVAVWAADEVQARLLLLRRWLDARDTGAWFWQRLLPAVPGALPLVPRLRALLFEAFDTAPADAGAAHAQRARLWRQALPGIEASGYLGALASALSPAQAELLGAQTAWRGAAHTASFEAAGHAAHRALPRLAAMRRPVLPREPQAADGDAMTAARPGPAGPAQQPERPEAAVPPAARGAPQDGMDARDAVHGAVRATAAESPAAPASRPGVPAVAAAPDRARETAWAGLWFLLPMLLREGLAQQAAPAALLAAVLQRARARYGLDAVAGEWIDQVACLAATDEAAARAAQSAAGAWWRRARQLSLTHARLPLRRVLLRPARVWLAPHRVDLVFPLHGADVRIRRAGFDIDPGYVPWLDAVIRFHYQR